MLEFQLLEWLAFGVMRLTLLVLRTLRCLETVMRPELAMAIVRKARIRRRIPAASVVHEQVGSSPEHPIDPHAGRDAKGRFAKGWRGGPGGLPRDALCELFVDDLFQVWRRRGRAIIHAFAQEHPAEYLRLIAALAEKEQRRRVRRRASASLRDGCG
jgi:hypothetical protein